MVVMNANETSNSSPDGPTISQHFHDSIRMIPISPPYVGFTERPFVCIAPGSVWFTKTWPAAQWIKLIQSAPPSRTGTAGLPVRCSGEHTLAESILCQVKVEHNLAGELRFSSAALMSKPA